jgi:ribosomal protein L29
LYRKADVKDFRKRLSELRNNISLLQGKSYVGQSLGETASNIKKMKKEVAILLTIAKERNMRL